MLPTPVDSAVLVGVKSEFEYAVLKISKQDIPGHLLPVTLSASECVDVIEFYCHLFRLIKTPDLFRFCVDIQTKMRAHLDYDALKTRRVLDFTILRIFLGSEVRSREFVQEVGEHLKSLIKRDDYFDTLMMASLAFLEMFDLFRENEMYECLFECAESLCDAAGIFSPSCLHVYQFKESLEDDHVIDMIVRALEKIVSCSDLPDNLCARIKKITLSWIGYSQVMDSACARILVSLDTGLFNLQEVSLGDSIHYLMIVSPPPLGFLPHKL